MSAGRAVTKLPDSLTILGRPWRVLYVTPRTIRRHSPAAADDHGITDGARRVIYITAADAEDCQWSTLLHEMMHATLREAWDQEAIGIDFRQYEEPLVMLLEKGLFPALRATGWGPQE